jgi:hypothetical protein
VAGFKPQIIILWVQCLPLRYQCTTNSCEGLIHHFFSPGARGRIQTLHIRLMSQVFYHCVANAQTIVVKDCWPISGQRQDSNPGSHVYEYIVYHCTTNSSIGLFHHFLNPGASGRIQTLDVCKNWWYPRNTVAEHLAHNPMINGLNPTTDYGRENRAKTSICSSKLV